MERIININGKDVLCNINYKRIKNLYIRLEDDVLIINAPFSIKEKDLYSFIITSYPKLLKKQNKKNAVKKSVFNKEGKVKVFNSYYDVKRKDIDSLLKDKINEYLLKRYDFILKMMGIKNKPLIKLVRVKTYLGQYNKKTNTIRLNVLAAHLDEELFEYVLIHELAHTKFLHHKKEFWDYLKIYCPYYKMYRRRAKKEFIYYENN